MFWFKKEQKGAKPLWILAYLDMLFIVTRIILQYQLPSSISKPFVKFGDTPSRAYLAAYS